MDPIEKYVERIVQECPSLTADEIQAVATCLRECFELGKEWEDIPILVQEAKRPPKRGEPKRRAV